jgi:hypothetical protein
MTMLTDGIKSKNLEDEVRQLDVAELLDRSCAVPAASVVDIPASGGPAPPEQADAPTAE